MRSADWRFIGRAGDLAVLSATEADPACTVLVVYGARGVGRTALLEQWFAALPADRSRHWITATRSAAHVPLGAFAGLPEWPEVTAGLTSDLDRIAAVLRTARSARGYRPVLVIDDAHLLDDTSAALIHHLARTGAVFVVLSMAHDGRAPDGVSSLGSWSRARRLDLPPLSDEEIATLLVGVLGGMLDPEALRRLTTLGRGNLWFLRELLAAGAESGDVICENGVWYFRVPDRPSQALRRIVDSLLADPSERQRELLRLLAFAGELSETDLTTLAHPQEDAWDLVDNDVLVLTSQPDAKPVFTIRVPVVAEVIRGATPPGRARSLSRLLADTLGPTTTDTVRLAQWRLEGGNATPEELYDGAIAAMHQHQHPLALRLADAALAAGAGFEAGMLAAQLAGTVDGPTAAERRLDWLAGQAVSDDERGRVVCARLEILLMSTTRRAEALRLMAETRASITDPGWRDRVEALRIVGALMPGKGPRAAGEAALEMHERTTGPARVAIAFGAAYSLGRVGRIELAVSLSHTGYEEHRELDEPIEWQPWHHLWARCEAMTAGGRLAESEALSRVQYQLGLESGDLEARAWFARHLAANELQRGRVRGAIQLARESASLFSRLGKPYQSTWVTLPLVTALAISGDPDTADEELARAASQVDQAFLVQVEALNTRAWIAVARGDLAQAREHLLSAAAHGRAAGDLVGAVAALHDMARIGYAQEITGELAEVAAEVEGPLVAAKTAHAAALAARDPGRLSSASKAFADTGADLLAAEAAFDTATAWHQRGSGRNARLAERHAMELHSRCPSATTPALSTSLSRAQLTRAEQETAALAAAGLTNREIAEQQELSIRTVQNRLQSIYLKLGIKGREDITSAMRI